MHEEINQFQFLVSGLRRKKQNDKVFPQKKTNFENEFMLHTNIPWLWILEGIHLEV